MYDTQGSLLFTGLTINITQTPVLITALKLLCCTYILGILVNLIILRWDENQPMMKFRRYHWILYFVLSHFFSFSQPSSDKYLLTGNLLTRKAFWTQMEVSLEIQSTNYILHSYFAYSHSSTNIIFKINQQLLFSVIKRQFIFVACKKYI